MHGTTQARPLHAVALAPLIAVLALAGCSWATPTETGEHAAHWTYEGAEGPAHWGELEGFETCGTGTAQSPIDLADPDPTDLPDIAFNYAVASGTVVNNGHTVEAAFQSGGSIVVDGRTYTFKQVHFHSPSEHTVSGKAFPVELHFVHVSADGTFAVVGEFVEEGAANAAWDAVVDAMPASGEVSVAGVDLAALLPTDRTFLRYSGSLTTPPCTEGVVWSVLATPITMDADQIAALEDLYEGNNRPVQPRGVREIDLDSTRGK